MNHRKLAFLSALAPLFLAACGGGGGDDEAPNTPPTLGAQNFAVAEDGTLNAQIVATDPGDTLTFTIATSTTHGALTVTPTGAFTYTPGPNYNGADTFQVTVRDSAQQAVTGSMQVIVNPTNDPPTATDDVLTLTSAADINVLANDSDPDNDTQTVSLIGATFPAGATVGANGRVSFPVAAGFKGLVRFRYRITDPAGATSEATAVGYVNVPPFKAVFLGPAVGSPSGANARVHVNDFLATSTADGGPQSPLTRLWVAKSGTSLVYEMRVDLGASHHREELFHVGLAQPGVRHTVTGEVAEGLASATTLLTDDGRYVVYALSDAGSSSAIYRFDAQNPTALLQRISPAATDLQFTTAPKLNAAGTVVYYGGRAPSNGATAGYRTNILTAATERVTPQWLANNGIVGVGVDYIWPKADESLVVFHVLEQLFPPDPHNSVQFSDPAVPGTSRLLHFPPPAAASYDPPMMSPDGLHAVINRNFGVVLTRTDAPSVETEIGSANFSAQRLREVPDAERAMRADSQAALVISGCGAPAQFPNVPCDVFEVSFATPSTPVRVNTANPVGQNASLARYSSNGDTVWFLLTSNQGVTLQATRRGSFGTQSTMSPAGFAVHDYELDRSGNVAIVSVSQGGGARTLKLVNVDVPGEALDLGTGSQSDSWFYLVNR